MSEKKYEEICSAWMRGYSERRAVLSGIDDQCKVVISSRGGPFVKANAKGRLKAGSDTSAFEF